MGDSSKLIRQLRDGEFGGWVGSEAADAIEAQAKRIEELEAAYVRLSDKELRERQTLDDVWQDLHAILNRARAVLRDK